MPKRKTAPRYSKASPLEGEDKPIYLARGEVAPDANHLALWVKANFWKKVRLLKRPDPNDADIAQELVAKCDEELAYWGETLRWAVINNDANFFRQIADVLDQHVANGERITQDFRIERGATDQLAHDIAAWAVAKSNAEKRIDLDTLREIEPRIEPTLYFSELWAWLEKSERWAPVYGKLRTANRVKSAQNAVRRTAKSIGVKFAIEKPGTKRA